MYLVFRMQHTDSHKFSSATPPQIFGHELRSAVHQDADDHEHQYVRYIEREVSKQGRHTASAQFDLVQVKVLGQRVVASGGDRGQREEDRKRKHCVCIERSVCIYGVMPIEPIDRDEEERKMKRIRRETAVLKREINKHSKRGETRMTGFSMNEEGKTNFGASEGYCFFFREYSAAFMLISSAFRVPCMPILDGCSSDHGRFIGCSLCTTIRSPYNHPSLEPFVNSPYTLHI